MVVTVMAALGALVIGVSKSYDDMAASEKQDYLWSKVMADTRSDSYMNPLWTVIKVTNAAYLWLMERTFEDWRESGHHKITHGVGAHAKVHFEWEANEYTGMFQQADNCVLRMANAAAPGGIAMGPYGPNLAVKCLRSGAGSANMQFIWQLDGYAKIPEGTAKSCSYFEAPLSNHNPLRDDISTGLKDIFVKKGFNQVDNRSMMLGVSQFATADQHGSHVHKPNFPFALVLQPTPGLNSVTCKFDEPISQLLNLKEAGFRPGQALYHVYAVHDPMIDVNAPKEDAVKRLGSIVLDSDFTSSKWGDTELFFRHTFFAVEEARLKLVNASRAKLWTDYLDDPENYKLEGANLYWPLLPKTDLEETFLA